MASRWPHLLPSLDPPRQKTLLGTHFAIVMMKTKCIIAMAKTLDLRKTVYELVRQYPEVADIMAGLGFGEIRKKAVLNSVGKLMTIPKGAKFRKMNVRSIVKKFEENGFNVIGLPDGEEAPDSTPLPSVHRQRLQLLKGYLARLNNGEPLETVRAEFVRNFSTVDASEIMEAEQELLRDGAPLRQVQQLCDVHSALFHGSTQHEAKEHHDKAAGAFESARRQEPSTMAMASRHADEYATLATIEGHPLQTLSRENEALLRLIGKAHAELDHRADCFATLRQVHEVAVHYAKKGDLLYPLLRVRYGIIGPSQVMWTLDDEIRAELSALAKADSRPSAQGETGEAWRSRVSAVLQRAEEMVYKEANILFPVCAANFSEAEWMQIYHDAKDYATCLGVKPAIWREAEETARKDKPAASDGNTVSLPTGQLTIGQLRALLNTLPLEITFVDADNLNRYFNEGSKVFKRPLTALGREVFTCHPPKIEPMVRKIIDDFRNNRRDQVPIWMTKNGRAVLVDYMAVRDASGHYLGTMEVVQDMEFVREHFAHQK